MSGADDLRAAARSAARVRWIVTMIGIGWMILSVRLIQLQWWQQERFAGQVEQQRELVEEIPARPGDIVDRQGRLLATTLTTRSLYAVPSRITDPAEFARAVAGSTGLSVEALQERLQQNASRQFLWIKRRLSDLEVEQIKQCRLPKGSWGFRDEYRREYPQGVVAAHVIGLRDIDGVGRGGVEESFDRQLRGQNGQRQMARDARGHVIEIIDETYRAAVPGQIVQLTIDVILQLYAERELDAVMQEWKPQSCCAIVMDPATGDILAMAGRPTFDPNQPDDASPESWKNRAIGDVYEPGSTIKPMIVGYGLDQGLLEKSEQFQCENGVYRMGRRLLHDHHRYGLLSLTDVLVKSSNIGMAKIGERLANEGLYDAVTRFGFGRKTGIPLPGEQAGILRPLAEWTSYSTGSIPMGHELAATPLQLITAHAALANGGRLVPPRVTRHDEASDESLVHSLSETVISPETAHWIVEHPMQEVVTRGTGKKAQLRGYHVFGKTGTAQCLSPAGGYLHGLYNSSFICGAPVESPRVLVLVVVNQSSVGGETFGGKVAAPAAARILEQALIHLRVAPTGPLADAVPSKPNSASRR